MERMAKVRIMVECPHCLNPLPGSLEDHEEREPGILQCDRCRTRFVAPRVITVWPNAEQAEEQIEPKGEKG